MLRSVDLNGRSLVPVDASNSIPSPCSQTHLRLAVEAHAKEGTEAAVQGA